MSKRFRRTPEEIKAGLTVEQAKKARETKELQKHADDFTEQKKWEHIAEKVTQENLDAKHEENPTIETVTGAGDIVEGITKATGIKKVVEFFTPEGKDCGCDDRKKAMNAIPIIRHKTRVECLTVEEYNFMSPLLSNNSPISGANAKKLLEIYERVFNVKIASSCNGCSMSKKIDELKAVLKTYE